MKKSIKLFLCLTLIFVCAFMSPVGVNEVDYTLPVIGGTKTHTLMVSIKPTFSGGVVKVTLGSNI